MDNKALIIYHREDNDGLFSMAITYWGLRKGIKDIQTDDIEILGADYNNLSDMLKNGKFDNLSATYKYLVITDVSFNEQEEMLKLYKEFGDNFLWFDHHKPIINFSETNDLHNAKGIRTTMHSALYNAWDYFFGADSMPEYLKLLSAYDSFSFEQEKIDKEFATNVNQGTTNDLKLSSKDIIALVSCLMDKSIDEKTIINKFYKIGKRFNDDQDAFHAKNINDFGDTSWTVGGRKACAMFVQEQTSSDFFKSLKKTDIVNGVIFKHLKNGNWGMSLYNVNPDTEHSFHCGDYLKEHYNGGGHEGAAGCTLSLQQFIDILKTKKI